MTVSRVLRGQGGSQFEEQVLAAVRQLDYVPVRSAVQNRHVKTNVIGALLDAEFSFESELGRQTFDGLRRAAFQAGYDVLLLRPQQHEPLEKQKIPFLDRRCDGFVFVVPWKNPEILNLLVKYEFPTVTCYSTDIPAGLAYVVPENIVALEKAVGLLRECGHRRIAFWGASRGHSDARERFESYERAMRFGHLEPLTFDTPFHGLASPLDSTAPILNLVTQQKISAVICHNDERALALWDAALQRGWRVPDDLSLIGIDNMPAAALRGLTTFANPFFDIGWNAAQSLLSALQGNTIHVASNRLPMPLIERESVAVPKD